MKKKLFSLLLVFCLALPIGLGLVGCGGNDNSSTSGGGEQQQSQSSGKSDKEVLSSVYEEVVNTAMPTASDNSSTPTSMRIAMSDETTNEEKTDGSIFVEADNMSNLGSTYAMVLLMKAIYSNTLVTSINVPLQFNCSYKKNDVIEDGPYNIVLYSKIDRTNNKIIGQVLSTDASRENIKPWFISLDIDYNFETETLTSYTMYFGVGELPATSGDNQNSSEETQSNQYQNLNFCAKYENGKIYWTGHFDYLSTDAQIVAEAKALGEKYKNLLSSFLTVEKNKIVLNLDFSDAYTSAMDQVSSYFPSNNSSQEGEQTNN